MKIVNLDDVRKRIEATLVFYGLDDTEMAVYLIHCCDTLPSALPEPTQKQVEYAKYLANRMCQKLPDEYTKEAYSKFISKWKPVVKHEDDAMNEPSEWQMRYM